MKKLILTCALLTSVSMLSFAQNAQTTPAQAPAQPNAAAQRQQVQPEQMAERRAQIYKKQFVLNDDQYKGIYDAELAFMKENQKIRASGQQPNQQQMQQLMADRDAKFKKVMTEDQYTKYSASRPQPGAPRPPAMAPAPAKN